MKDIFMAKSNAFTDALLKSLPVSKHCDDKVFGFTSAPI